MQLRPMKVDHIVLHSTQSTGLRNSNGSSTIKPRTHGAKKIIQHKNILHWFNDIKEISFHHQKIPMGYELREVARKD